MAKNTLQNIEAEKSVLGYPTFDSKSIDVSNRGHSSVRMILPDQHKIIYEAMVDLYQNKEPIDVLSLSAGSKMQKTA